ncbi:MAG: phosphate ABC transporter permease PstA [Pseudorhodoplanes sp.]|jgi:phosphate transport system permease protein|nr:phosphate ABC transporter permease PstA [Pseudorhodoplanes sp.]
MIDVTAPAIRTVDVATDAAKARIRARYRAETRFKFYGMAAIFVSGLFLVVVLADILMKGLPAFTQHQLEMQIKIDAAEIDPQGARDPVVIRGGDFQLLIRNALRAQFPEVTDRAGRRLLDGILSSGASDLLRERVVADPALIGQTVSVPVLISDDADLYYKGLSTQIERVFGRGTATPSGTSGAITIQTPTDDFAQRLAEIKQFLSVSARAERLEADRFKQIAARANARKKELESSLAGATRTDRIAGLEDRIKAAGEEAENFLQRAKQLEDSAAALQARFDDHSGSETLTADLPSLLVAVNGGLVKASEVHSNGITGDVLLPLHSDAEAPPESWQVVTFATPESNRRVTDREVAWLERLRESGMMRNNFNWAFFTSGDSREPELAGIRGALVGSALTLFVTLILCVPFGVAGAVYLEEFAPKNRLTEIIEVNINNLAAVPSIVFGLLGLSVFLNFFGLPRSAPLVGGLVLALLVLPTIIIAARAALRAVPPSIKEAALGVGASHQQAIFHHVLPLAMPGIMTGTIIGMAHALGETAPLLMIGMVAFIVEPATSITDAATVLPVQIYLWSDLPEIAFQSKTAAAIIVLLAFLFVMNGMAIFLRRRFERRW